jgi:NTP pyrophosphatase (non-canonical NTP hydrolase)
MKQLEEKVLQWAKERGLINDEGMPLKATPSRQYLKTVEEVGELGAALIEKDIAEIKDAIGDIIVTLIIQSAMQGLDLQYCLQSAYNEIADRKGEMINGVFVKEGEK